MLRHGAVAVKLNITLFFDANLYFWFMSKHHLREEKNCLNCGNSVNQRFCGNCGQENIEPRQTFGHLVAHFFEDLTHYEGKFWGTLRYLFFRPAFLTKEFLEGKRNRYLPPVRLYIFASFITFFLPAIIPGPPNNHSEAEDLEELSSIISSDSLQHGHNPMDSVLNKLSPDSVKKLLKKSLTLNDRIERENMRRNLSDEPAEQGKKNFGYTQEHGFSFPTEFERITELDSAKNARKGTHLSIGYIEYNYNKRAIELRHSKYSPTEQLKMFWESLQHNFPKALFLYMPLFALTLRLFHKRKNWIYFDHGIFTLHLFSFILLAFLGMLILSKVDDWIAYIFHTEMTRWIFTMIMMVIFLWFPYYLFRAHRKMYEESRWISALKTWMILMLNSVLFIMVFFTLALYTLFTMH